MNERIERPIKLEQDFRRSLAALQTYCENQNKLDDSREIVRLMDELKAASNALATWR